MSNADRRFRILTSRWLGGWRNSLLIVKPETVLSSDWAGGPTGRGDLLAGARGGASTPKPLGFATRRLRRFQFQPTLRLHDREVAHRDAERKRRRSDELLHAILPAAAVAKLKEVGRVRPRQFDEVAVLFIDLVGFTAWCHAHAPEQVVAKVQRLAEEFEVLATRHGMEKIKTIGDAFMATANLLEQHADPVGCRFS